MAERRLIYLTSWRATVYTVRRGAVMQGPTFPNEEEGYEQFTSYLAELPRSTLVYVLADVVEEDFHLEMVPKVYGSDRKQMVSRRLAQRYRDTSLSLALSLGTERGQRRDERLLLSSFTNTQLFQPWLNVLRFSELAVVGVYSVALIAAQLARRLGFGAKAPCLAVSLQPAGLRQTLIEHGRVRFSRLGPLEPGDLKQPARVAAAFAGETTRIHQYLTAVRILPRAGPPLDVLLLAPTGRRQLVEAAASSTAQVRYHVIDVAEAAHRIGLRDMPTDAGAEALYLYLLANRAPRQQYAGEQIRQQYRTHEGRVALLTGGGLLFLVCALFSGYQWLTVMENRARMAEELQRSRAVSEDYARVTRNFPAIPTTAENLRVAVEQFEAVEKQGRAPEAMLVELARALDVSPNLALESLRWELGAQWREQRADTRKGGGAPQRPDAKGAPGTPRYDIVEVSGRIRNIPASDYRALTKAVDDLVSQLRLQAGIVILATRLPFDVDSDTTLSGDISEVRDRDVPSFQVTFGKRVGAS